MKTLAQLAGLLDIDRDTVKVWAVEYREHLSDGANPPAGQTRVFNTDDLRVMALVAEYMEAGEGAADIHDHLGDGAHNADRLVRWAYENSPLFDDDPPDGLDGQSYGSVFGGMASRENNADVARSFWRATKELLRCLRESGYESYELDFPILYQARHTVELYLKALLRDPPECHDLDRLIRLVEQQYGNRLSGWIGDRLRDFHKIDRDSDYFRYSRHLAPGEYWIDFNHLEVVMDGIVRAFERELRGVPV
jgi:hypothetical protein